MKIGVFDSGVGSEVVARDLRAHFPKAMIVSVSDQANLPYGSKSPERIIALTDTAMQSLLAARCDIIVIACNTATTIALPHLRNRYPNQKFIGIEPMIKTARERTKTGVIAVCATPATLASERYGSLKNTYASNLMVHEPDCSSWASMIEANAVNEQTIRTTIGSVIADNADVIVLGCTHYHWIKDLIQSIAGDQAAVIEPTEAIARRIRQLIGSPPRQTDRHDQHSS